MALLRRLVVAAASFAAIAAVAVGCSSSDSGEPVTRAVPADYPSIQAAVDASSAGDLVLVSPGIYRESVVVIADGITIRGTDRNGVVLDGGDDLGTGIRVVDTSGVAVENLTVRNFGDVGVSWTNALGFRAAYVTAYRNGRNGVSVFDSVNGTIEHVWTSGSSDSGVSINQCFPCRIRIDDVTARDNGVGVLLTNAGGDLQVINSTFASNRIGVLLQSGSFSLCHPQQSATIAGNVVTGNGRTDLPLVDAGLFADRSGIVVAGGRNNVIEANRVDGTPNLGIALVPYPEAGASTVSPDDVTATEPCSSRSFVPSTKRIDVTVWQPTGNRVEGNVSTGAQVADLALGVLDTDPAALRNCFSSNVVTRTAPAELQSLAPCDGPATANDWSTGALTLVELDRRERVERSEFPEMEPQPIPGPQPSLPDAATAPARPATVAPAVVDIAAIEVPAASPTS